MPTTKPTDKDDTNGCEEMSHNGNRMQNGLDVPLPDDVIDSDPVVTRVRRAQIDESKNSARCNLADAHDFWELNQGEQLTVEVHRRFVVIYPTNGGE